LILLILGFFFVNNSSNFCDNILPFTLPLQRYEAHNSKLSSQDLYTEGAICSSMHGSDYQDKLPHYQLERKSAVLNHIKTFGKRNSSSDLYEDSAGETSVYNSKKNKRMGSKHGVEGMRIDSITSHHGRCDGKIESKLHEYDNVSPKIVQRREYFKSKPSNLICNLYESIDTEERGLSTRKKKVYFLVWTFLLICCII
jgi:hypothetical protein